MFAWTQARVHLPVWFGVGFSLKAEIDAGNLPKLKEMYAKWPFFQSTMELIEAVMAKVPPFLPLPPVPSLSSRSLFLPHSPSSLSHPPCPPSHSSLPCFKGRRYSASSPLSSSCTTDKNEGKNAWVLAFAFRGAGCRGQPYLRHPDSCLNSLMDRSLARSLARALSLSSSLSFALALSRARAPSLALSRFLSRSIDCPCMEQVDIEIVMLYQKELVTPDLLPVGDMVFAELASTIEHVKMVRNTF